MKGGRGVSRKPSFAAMPGLVLLCALAAYAAAAIFSAIGVDERWVELREGSVEGLCGLALPAEAVHSDEDGDYVWVITAGRLEKKTVKIICAGDGFLLAEESAEPWGLREGDAVVTAGRELYEGKILT